MFTTSFVLLCEFLQSVTTMYQWIELNQWMDVKSVVFPLVLVSDLCKRCTWQWSGGCQLYRWSQSIDQSKRKQADPSEVSPNWQCPLPRNLEQTQDSGGRPCALTAGRLFFITLNQRAECVHDVLLQSGSISRIVGWAKTKHVQRNKALDSHPCKSKGGTLKATPQNNKSWNLKRSQLICY